MDQEEEEEEVFPLWLCRQLHHGTLAVLYFGDIRFRPPLKKFQSHTTPVASDLLRFGRFKTAFQ